MRLPFRSLTSRMVAIAVAQMLVLSVAAMLIFRAVRPELPRFEPPRGAVMPERLPPPPRGLLLGPLLTMGCGFVVLALGAALTARWIIRPVQHLSSTAKKIGEGDLTARSALVRTDEIGDLGRHLDDMTQQLERLIAAERELLANVAHELRTPLTRMGVALDLGAEGNPDRARTALVEIAEDVAELDTIVDDILTAMRFEARRGSPVPLRLAPVAPGALAEAAAARHRRRHPDRPLDVSIAGGLPDVEVDPALFRRVLDNLLENADKYTPEGGAPLTLSVAADVDAVVRFVVTDPGTGIAPTDLPRVYDAFFRGERSRSRETGGVGLGLTLARRIVDAHGGTITLASTVGQGTCATVSVPRAG